MVGNEFFCVATGSLWQTSKPFSSNVRLTLIFRTLYLDGLAQLSSEAYNMSNIITRKPKDQQARKIYQPNNWVQWL